MMRFTRLDCMCLDHNAADSYCGEDAGNSQSGMEERLSTFSPRKQAHQTRIDDIKHWMCHGPIHELIIMLLSGESSDHWLLKIREYNDTSTCLEKTDDMDPHLLADQIVRLVDNHHGPIA